MNLILIDSSELVGNTVRLQDRRAKHIVKVLRSEPGDDLKVGVINGRIGIGKVRDIQKKHPFCVDLEVHLEANPPSKSPVDIILALPRPIMLRRIIGQISSLGVGKMYIINAARVEKSFWDAGIIDRENYMEHILQGLEQSIDTIPSQLQFHRGFKPFVEDYLPTITNYYSACLYADPTSSRTLHDSLKDHKGKVIVAIGPEGGWVDYELAKFLEIGFSGFSIGPRILRVDTAVVNIHGRIMAAMTNSN